MAQEYILEMTRPGRNGSRFYVGQNRFSDNEGEAKTMCEKHVNQVLSHLRRAFMGTGQIFIVAKANIKQKGK